MHSALQLILRVRGGQCQHQIDSGGKACLERWGREPYWQHFCGEGYFLHTLPIDPSQITRFRDRISEEGCEFITGRP